MIEVKDRVPTRPGQYIMTDAQGNESVIKLTRDDAPTEPGTPVNKALFDSIKEDISKAGGTKIYTDISVTFVADTTYEDFPFKGTINLDGVTANDVAFVNFNPADSLSGIYSPFAITEEGKVLVFASEQKNTTIDNIMIVRGE